MGMDGNGCRGFYVDVFCIEVVYYNHMDQMKMDHAPLNALWLIIHVYHPTQLDQYRHNENVAVGIVVHVDAARQSDRV